MPKRLQEVISSLGTLNQTELGQVRAALDQLSAKRADDAADATLLLFHTVTRMLGVRLSWPAFHNMTAYKTWRRHAPTVISFIEETWPNQSKVMIGALLGFLIEMLIEHLKEAGTPVSVQSVTNNLSKLPAVFDLNFPDYRKSGLAYLIVAQMEQKRDP